MNIQLIDNWVISSLEAIMNYAIMNYTVMNIAIRVHLYTYAHISPRKYICKSEIAKSKDICVFNLTR